MMEQKKAFFPGRSFLFFIIIYLFNSCYSFEHQNIYGTCLFVFILIFIYALTHFSMCLFIAIRVSSIVTYNQINFRDFEVNICRDLLDG
jgi:hypothetical protein